MKHILTVILIGVTLGISLSADAQRKGYKFDKKQRKNFSAFPSPNNFRQSGWAFDAGLTATFGLNPEIPSSGTDTTLSLPTQLRPGIALNAGRFYNFKKGKIIRYIDYNLGYKLLWNAEKQEVSTSIGESTSQFLNNQAHYADVNINFNNVINLSDFTFIQNTIGVNIDYRFSESTNQNSPNPSPDPLVIQAHYKLAFGFMVDNDIAVIPYLEIPLFNITPTQKNFSQLDYFNQSYQTFIVGIRVMLFRYGQKDCPKAINHDGYDGNGY